ncbi:MAG: carboxyltransferase domain-containing protein [Actinomycetota bacterium]|nr:carboxyltransferase domain-containing protein [Actinomycetota bacterium]
MIHTGGTHTRTDASGTVRPYGELAVIVDVDTVWQAHRLAAAIDRALVERHALAPAPGPSTGVDDVVVGLRCVVVRLADGAAPVGDWVRWLVHDVIGSLGADSVGPPDPGRPPGAEPDDRWRATGPGGAGTTRDVEEHHEVQGWREARTVTIPVAFDGPDLDELARSIGRRPDDVVAMVTGAELVVAFVGFAPGFPYLVGLPDVLAAVERRATPRTRVPAGSFAIGGGFAGIYPESSPGGWHLLGRTSLRLFDPGAHPPCLLQPGDRVRLVDSGDSGDSGDSASQPVRGPVTTADRRRRTPAVDVPMAARRSVTVQRAGTLALIQDTGRAGAARWGVPRAGPADPDAFVLANLLVGNEPHAPGIEWAGEGPGLRFDAPAHAAVVSAPGATLSARLDGLPVAVGTVIPVSAGQFLELGPPQGAARAYLAVGGGIRALAAGRDVLAPAASGTDVLASTFNGSLASDVTTTLGPPPLSTGMRLILGDPTHPRSHLLPVAAALQDRATNGSGANGSGASGAPLRTVRIIPGPHGVDDATGSELARQRWCVQPEANRMGVRLAPAHDGAPPPSLSLSLPSLSLPTRIPSLPMVLGAVQVPPDGRPIILLPDHATVGGYPVVGIVASVDRAIVGQLTPGVNVRFVWVSLDEAADLTRRHRSLLSSRVVGRYPIAE